MQYFNPPDPGSVFYQDSHKYHAGQYSTPPPPQSFPPPPQNAQGNFQPASYSYYQQQREEFVSADRVLDPTPNATSSLVCAIISLLASLAWCKWYGTVVGLLSACITLYLANGGLEILRTSPHVFSQRGRGNLQAAKILGIISLCVSILWILGLLVYYFTRS